MKSNPHEVARAKRDRLALRLFLWTFIPLIITYTLADCADFIPAQLSIRSRNAARYAVDPDYLGEGADPDQVLGIAIGDTRFRLNYGSGNAIVTRPIFGVEEWIIPAHFEYNGTQFTVTALDPFAFLYATHAHTISLPHTLQYENGALELATDCLKHLYRRQSDGTTQEQQLSSTPLPLLTE